MQEQTISVQTANSFFNNKTTTIHNNNTNNNNNTHNINNNTPYNDKNLTLTKSSTSVSHSNLSPIFIALIIIIPILAAILSILYFRKSIFNRSNTLPHQANQTSQSPLNLIVPPGGTGADRPINQRRTDRLRRIIGAINRRSSRSESIRTVPEYSADPQGTEISLAHAQGSTPDSNLVTRFINQNHLTNPSRTQYTLPQIQPTNSLISPGLNHHLSQNSNNNHYYHYTQDPPPDYDISTRSNHPSSSTTTTTTNNLPNPIQVVIPPQVQDSSYDHHQNLHIHRTLTSSSDDTTFTTHPNNKPVDSTTTRLLSTMIHSEFSGLFSSSSVNSTPSPLPNTMINTTSTASSSTNNLNPTILSETIQTPNSTSNPSSTVSTNHQQTYYRIPSGAPTPQQLSFLTRIGNLSRLGLPRPPQLVNHLTVQESHPPPPFDIPSSLPTTSNYFPPTSNLH